MRNAPLTALLIACATVLAATPARAATDAPAGPAPDPSAPVVVPVPAAPAPTETAAPVLAPPTPPPQAEDDETPHAHRAPGARAEAFDGSEAPRSAEPETQQLMVGLLVGVLTVVATIKTGASLSGNARWFAAGGILAGGAAATGLITCAIGQGSPTRHRGCGASLAGALIGALGVVPGLLVLKYATAQPCTEKGPNDDDKCAVDGAVDAIMGIALAGGGYVLGTAFGARTGWELGAVPRATAPAANVTLLSLTF